MMWRRLAVSAVLVLSACGKGTADQLKTRTVGVTDDAGATRALGALLASVHLALAGANPGVLSARASVPGAAAPSLNATCSGGGNVTGTETIATTATGVETRSDLAFAACRTANGTLDGSLSYDFQLTNSTTDFTGSLTMNGQLAFESADNRYAGDFSFRSLTLTYDCTTTGCATLTQTGTFSVGGQTYSVDSSTFATFVGAL